MLYFQQRIRVLFFLLCISPSSLLAVTAIDVTQVGTSARHIGYANINGFNTTASSIFENPGSLYGVEHWSASFFSTQIMNNVSYVALSGAYRFKYGVLAFARMGASVSDIPNTSGEYDNNELIGINIRSLFEYANYVYKLGYQTMLKNQWSLGLALNYYSVNAGGHLEGNGANLDIGVARQFDRLDFSGVVQNAIPDQHVTYRNNGDSEKTPTRYSLGSRYQITDYFSALSEVRMYEFHSDLFLSAAVEYVLFSQWLKNMDASVRLGHRNFPVSPIRMRSATTIGLGFVFHFFNLDYAYQLSEHPDYDFQHYVSFSIAMPVRFSSKLTDGVASNQAKSVTPAYNKPYKLVLGSHQSFEIAKKHLNYLSQNNIDANLVIMYPNKNKKTYAMQIGAYKTEAQCQKKSDSYFQRGVMISCAYKINSKTQFNYVLIEGVYANRALANRAAAKFQTLGIATYIREWDRLNEFYVVWKGKYPTQSLCQEAVSNQHSTVLNAYCVYHEE
ncbi:MAG: SPOR domain-containing protein [Candidatus Marinamargulisbacteria bacterium]|nr:SPOR domain-containing protein [Candidatus Marinamargulisbacteria bacterium]